MEEKLQQILKKLKKPVSLDKICEKAGVATQEEYDLIVKLLEEQVRNYLVIKTTHDNYIPIMKTSFRKGRFYANRGGDGKVVVTSSYFDGDGKQIIKEDTYIISKADTNCAIDGDIVLIDFGSNNKKNLTSGVITQIIERDLNNIVGEVYRIGGSYFVKPINKKKQGLTIALEKEAIEGQRVAVSLKQQTSDNFYIGEVERVFSHKDDPDEDILWEAFKCGIEAQFSLESLEQVKYIPQSVSDVEKLGRMDLTNWEIFTIDGEDTKDIDDAISCRVLDNGNYLVGVHIADVSYYVPENSPLDKDAFKRGTSAYLAGKVIPMLPHELSNGICSLNPLVPRLSISCIMEVNRMGNVVRHDVWQSVICSRLKMSYTKVNNILKDNIIDAEYLEYADTLRNLNSLALILRKNRIKNGAVEFDRPELKLELDEEGKTKGFSLRIQDLGENLIEEFMILANETIDKHLCDIGAPCLHRIHDEPNQERLADFIRLLHAIGYIYNKYDSVTCSCEAKALQDLALYIKNTGKFFNMLSTNMIRCMSRAKYSPINIGHSGLAKSYYCHFTSPIRRYPDLINHRLLKDCYFDRERAEKNKRKWERKLPEIGMHSSKMEKIADEAEMQTLYMRCAEYMKKYIGHDFEGIVIGVSDHGLQIQLDNYIEGRVHVRNLPGNYVYSPTNYALLSLDGKGDYYIGDRLSLKLKDANKETKKIDFQVNDKLEKNHFDSSENSYVKAKNLI